MESNTTKSIHYVITLLAIYQDLQIAQLNLFTPLALFLSRNLKQVYNTQCSDSFLTAASGFLITIMRTTLLMAGLDLDRWLRKGFYRLRTGLCGWQQYKTFAFAQKLSLPLVMLCDARKTAIATIASRFKRYRFFVWNLTRNSLVTQRIFL